MRILRVSLCLVAGFVLAACAASHTPSSPGIIMNPVSPQVVQGGGPPPEWVAFNVPAPNGDNFYYVHCIANGPDGNLWTTQQDLTDSDDAYLDSISMSGATKQFHLPNLAPNCVTQGPDKNMWFTPADANAIGKITPSGMTTYYQLPMQNNNPNLIMTGPDKNLWFTAFNPSPGMIGHITTSGSIKEFQVTGVITAMTSGPDGAVWFTEPYIGVIGRVTTSGSVTYFGTNHGSPYGIVTGPDGNIWFTDENSPNGAIGKMATNGSFVEFALPGGTKYPGPGNMTVGVDGKIYFLVGDGIGQIDTAGHIKFYSNGAFPRLGDGTITTGRDGNLWVTWSNTDFRHTKIVVLVRNTMYVAPTSIDLTAVGQQQTVTVKEYHFSGTWSGSTSNLSVATVAAGVNRNLFTVTATGVGSATVTIADTKGNSVPIAVIVH